MTKSTLNSKSFNNIYSEITETVND